MAGVVVIAVVLVFVFGTIVGAVLLVSIASLREDRDRLSQAAPNRIALAGRLVTGLLVENPNNVHKQNGFRRDKVDCQAGTSGRTP